MSVFSEFCRVRKKDNIVEKVSAILELKTKGIGVQHVVHFYSLDDVHYIFFLAIFE